MRKVITTITMTIFLVSAFAFAAAKQVSFVNQSKCAHCGTCQKTCPVKAISKVEDGKTVKFVVDPKKCLGCGACVKACPTKSISLVDPSAAKALPASSTTNDKDSTKVSEENGSVATPQSQDTKKK
jgi:formate hydrogenlyase subunit 6/NADH:ubiquinone oxidoreductase subunit I